MANLETLDRSEIARALARFPRRKRSLRCVVCGTAMEGIAGKKYCSARCCNQAKVAARRGRAATPLAAEP